MADFITRVELHNASAGEYALLHTEMSTRGFSQRISSRDGVIFGLPTAMYFYRDNALLTYSAENVRDLAKQAADITGRNSWIFTTAFTDAAWYLNTVQQA